VTVGGWGAVGAGRFLQGDVISIRQDAADLVCGRSDREAAALTDGIGLGRMSGDRRFVTLARWPEAVRLGVSPGWTVFISTAVAPWTVVICRDYGQCVCRNMINISERCVVYNLQTVWGEENFSRRCRRGIWFDSRRRWHGWARFEVGTACGSCPALSVRAEGTVPLFAPGGGRALGQV